MRWAPVGPSCRGIVRGKAFADGVIKRQRPQRDDVTGTHSVRSIIARGLAVGRWRQCPMSGDDATLTATVQYGMGGDDGAILKNATSLAVLCTSTVRRRALFGTL